MDNAVTIAVAVVASTGFWSLIQYIVSSKLTRESAESQMLKGLGHDRICFLAEAYIKRGSITREEYENLHTYLYLPYKRLGGNGTAQRLMDEVMKLPIV